MSRIANAPIKLPKGVEASMNDGATKAEAYAAIPEKLAFYDYVGNSPSKGGHFRVGAMVRSLNLLLLQRGSALFDEPLRLSDGAF